MWHPGLLSNELNAMAVYAMKISRVAKSLKDQDKAASVWQC